MAITDYIPSSLPGDWPGPSTDAPYVALLRVGYEDMMATRMQEYKATASKFCSRQVKLKGYETRIGRWGKATTVQRARAGFIGDDVTGGAPAAETPVNTYVIRGQFWEHPEYFDLRDEVGLMTLVSALTDATYKRNVLADLDRRGEAAFYAALTADQPVGDGGANETFAAGGGVKISGSLKSTGAFDTVVTKAHHRKLVELMSRMQVNDAWKQPGESYFSLHPIQFRQLLLESSTPFTSGDYNALRPLMNGQETSYLGMTWVMTTNVPAVADVDTNSGGSQAGHLMYAWNKMAVAAGYGQPRSWIRDIHVRGDTVLVYQSAFVGGARLDATGVTYTECQDLDAAPY